ncbi:hypothetical protein BDB00DRAFT_879851 [Zychaea mexicana]|nr:uncharacterized protein BDB00DRAFT_879851 [Zychaea mexicana]KAI9472894.1 hypothetical protein BDB00DRAFT_879851 [Zychaea mexicana]
MDQNNPQSSDPNNQQPDNVPHGNPWALEQQIPAAFPQYHQQQTAPRTIEQQGDQQFGDEQLRSIQQQQMPTTLHPEIERMRALIIQEQQQTSARQQQEMLE